MKSLNPARLLLLLAAVLVLPFAVAAAEAAAAAPVLYVTIDTSNPALFERLRYSRENGSEVVVTTLKNYAAKEAEFANFKGQVIVVDPPGQAPAGAMVLRFTWMETSVTADFIRGDAKPKYLGVVSRAKLNTHPDYDAMDREIRQAGPPDLVHDARLRISTRLNLFVGLERVVRELGSGS